MGRFLLWLLVVVVLVVGGSRGEEWGPQCWLDDDGEGEGGFVRGREGEREGGGGEGVVDGLLEGQVKEKKRKEKTLPRPELVKGQVKHMESYLMNDRYEYIVTSLEFDQDVYLNDPLVCSGSEKECPALTCKACDWTGENRTGCLDDDCCGVSAFPKLPAYFRREEWCDQSLPPFTKLNFGEESEKFELLKGEISYFRFFVSEQNYCQPIQVVVHADYGHQSLSINKFLAYPSYKNYFRVDYGRSEKAGRWERYTTGLVRYGQNIMTICPGSDVAYSVGTYSIAVEGMSKYTRFSVEVVYAEDKYPIQPPEDRIRCSDVPAEEFNLSSDVADQYSGSVCLEEGVTLNHQFGRTAGMLLDLVLPVLPGCREIQIAANGYLGQGTPLGKNQNFDFGDLICFEASNSTGSEPLIKIARTGSENSVYFAGCFDEITYLHCVSTQARNNRPMNFYWSSRLTPRRYKMTDLSPGMLSMTLGDSKIAVVAPDIPYTSAHDWGLSVSDYITQPTVHPLVFWPPAEPFIYDYFGNPPEIYRELVSGYEQQSNMLVVVSAVAQKNQEIRDANQLLENGFLVITGVTNIEGSPIKLRNDGQSIGGRSVTNWASHQTLRTFELMSDVSSECDSKRYFDHLELIQSITDKTIQSSDIVTVAEQIYLIDVLNAALPRYSCDVAAKRVMDKVSMTFNSIEVHYCPYEFGTPNWSENACCNEPLQAWNCCREITMSAEKEIFVGAEKGKIEGVCGEVSCSETHFSDLAKSLNSLGNSLIGCSSGIGDPIFETKSRLEKELDLFIRPCLEQSGFGHNFLGTACETDEDCAMIGYGCQQGICAVGSTMETQDRYLNCFINNMPSYVEKYLRRNVLSPGAHWIPVDSPQFKDQVKQAATIEDCLNPRDPKDLLYSEKWVANSAIFCRARKNGLNPFSEADVAETEMLCPERHCLGRFTCRFRNMTNCAQTAVICPDFESRYVPPSAENCPTNIEDCEVAGGSGNCIGSVCVGCDEEGNCVEAEGVGEGECGEEGGKVLCVTADGEWRFDLTKEECEDLEGECTVDCLNERCVSANGTAGICHFSTLTSNQSCGILGDWTEYRGTNGYCRVSDASTDELCQLAATTFGFPTDWVTCSSVSNCSADFDEAIYYSLSCAVDNFGPCETEEACLASGKCTDMQVRSLINYDPLEEALPKKSEILYGACYSSGEKSDISNKNIPHPFCAWYLGEVDTDYGCRFDPTYVKTEDDCRSLNVSGPDTWRRTRWIYPTKTEKECVGEGFGRQGCIFPGELNYLPFFFLEDECEYIGGKSIQVFEWTNPTWKKPRAYALEWKTKEPRKRYEWGDSLSLITLEDWAFQGIEEFLVTQFQSQALCENNYVTSSLSTLVCDCFSDIKDDSCFDPEGILTEVGKSVACANRSSVLKGPSSYTTFDEGSINDVCSEVYLYLIHRSWVTFPRSPPSLSFQFAERGERGVVLKNGVEVGKVVGDGSRILLERPERVDHFTTCLLVEENLLNDYLDQYKRIDFGVPSDNFLFIVPLELVNIEEKREESLLYWCAVLTTKDLIEDSMVVFPVVTFEDDEDADEKLSHQTKSLLYTLAACYIFDFVTLLIFLLVVFKKRFLVSHKLPLIFWLGVFLGIVCVFRIVFVFIYVNDGFSDLSEYVVFEIPTFLLFTVVVLLLVLFLQLSARNKVDYQNQDKMTWVGAFLTLAFIWSLFVVVTVVYSEVILESEEESVCPGRVQSDNDKVRQDTQTLTIIYQSIVIFLTLLFGLVFLKKAIELFHRAKNSGTKAKVFVLRLGAVTVSSFLLRTMLFLVLLALDLTSDIYLFVTLFLTEVVMIFCISLELNKEFYGSLASFFSNLSSSPDNSDPIPSSSFIWNKESTFVWEVPE